MSSPLTLTGSDDIITSLLTATAMADLGSDPGRCALFVGRRDWPGRQCLGMAAVQGGAPHTGELFGVCENHAHLVADPRPLT